MITLKELLTEDRKKVSKGCLMCYISEDAKNKLNEFGKQLIPEKNIYKEGDEYGYENEKHCTARYGFTKDLTKEQIEELIKDLTVFDITLSGISEFKNGEKEGYDVVKFDVDSDILNKLNKDTKKFPNEDTYPDFHAHVTIAYVKPDTFNETKKLDIKVPIDTIVYSPINGEKMYFKLPDKKKLNEGKLSDIKIKRVGLLQNAINKIENEIDRLDSMGGMENRISELASQLQKYQDELKGWESYTPMRENLNKAPRYSAIVLDDKSKNLLISTYKNVIPEGWEVIAHHCTINPFGLTDDVGKKVNLKVVAIGKDDKAIAVKVEGYDRKTNNNFAHVTIAINRVGGGKPKDSNDIKSWTNVSNGVLLSGEVKNL